MSETMFALARRKLVEGTEVLRTGGGASLTASECGAVLDELQRRDDEAATLADALNGATMALGDIEC